MEKGKSPTEIIGPFNNHQLKFHEDDMSGVRQGHGELPVNKLSD